MAYNQQAKKKRKCKKKAKISKHHGCPVEGLILNTLDYIPLAPLGVAARLLVVYIGETDIMKEVRGQVV